MNTEVLDKALLIEQPTAGAWMPEDRYGLFFIYVILSLSVNDVLVLFANHFGVNIHAALFNWASSILYFGLTFIFMRRLGFHYRDFGIHLKGAKRSLKEAIIICAAVILVALISFNVACFLGFAHYSLLWQGVKNLFGISSLLYLAHVVLQEVGFRGLYMGSLYKFMGRYHPFLIILLSSLVFGVLHSHFGLNGFLVAFAGSVLFGYIYIRHQNLLGVIFLHYILGLLAFSFKFIG